MNIWHPTTSEAADLDRADPPYRWPWWATLAFVVAVNAAAWLAVWWALVRWA